MKLFWHYITLPVVITLWFTGYALMWLCWFISVRRGVGPHLYIVSRMVTDQARDTLSCVGWLDSMRHKDRSDFIKVITAKINQGKSLQEAMVVVFRDNNSTNEGQ